MLSLNSSWSHHLWSSLLWLRDHSSLADTARYSGLHSAKHSPRRRTCPCSGDTSLFPKEHSTSEISTLTCKKRSIKIKCQERFVSVWRFWLSAARNYMTRYWTECDLIKAEYTSRDFQINQLKTLQNGQASLLLLELLLWHANEMLTNALFRYTYLT